MSDTPTSVTKLIDEIAPLIAGFELLSDHVVITDAHGRVLYANAAALQKTGFTKEEVIGEKPGKLWGGLMPKEFYADMWKTIAITKKPFIAEVNNMTKKHVRYWAELRITPVLDEQGDVSFFIAIEPDITERKKRNEELEEKREQLFHILSEREVRMHELKSELERLEQCVAP